MIYKEYNEYIKNYNRKWRENNKEYDKLRYLANKDKLLEQSKKWREENKEKVKEYYQKNKEEYKEKIKRIQQDKMKSILDKKCNLLSTNLSGLTIIEDGTVINKFGNEVGFKQLNGYSYVAVNSKQILKHRLIWEAFMGKIPEGEEIDHINTIRDDNRLENLRLVTSKQNKHNPKTIEHYKESNKGKGVNNPRLYDKKARKKIN
ncbi:MAG: HNH endonuclease [Methanobrevibacter sp.]|nr:HNH endonuclease [Methanobrevibacter sp.]